MVNRFWSSKLFSHQICFIIWVLLIVLSKIESCLTHWRAFLKVLNQNLNLKFHQMDFLFEFLNIHMNEKTITFPNCHDFKWKNINIYSILIFFFFDVWCPFWFVVLWLHPFVLLIWPIMPMELCQTWNTINPFFLVFGLIT